MKNTLILLTAIILLTGCSNSKKVKDLLHPKHKECKEMVNEIEDDKHLSSNQILFISSTIMQCETQEMIKEVQEVSSGTNKMVKELLKKDET